MGVAGAVAASYPTLFEPGWLEVTETIVKLQHPRREPLRLVQLTDLHASSPKAMALIDEAIGRALAAKPDVACITGDFITARADTVAAQQYVQSLRELAKNIPTFAVFGNHDGGVWASRRRGFPDTSWVRRVIEESGIELLHNRFRSIEVRGEKIAFAGVGDLWADQLDARRAFAGATGAPSTILLSHNPDSKEVLAQAHWDLMLSGHTHGGQVRLPFWEEGFAPVVDKRYVSGLKAWEGRQIFVSRGVGNLAGVRFRCRPEVSVLAVT